MIKIPISKLSYLIKQSMESLRTFFGGEDCDLLKEEGEDFDLEDYINTIYVCTSKDLGVGLIAFHTYYESYLVLVDVFEFCLLGEIDINDRSVYSQDSFTLDCNIEYLPYHSEDSGYNEDFSYISLKDFLIDEIDEEVTLSISKYDYKTLVKVLINKSVLLNSLFNINNSSIGISKELSIIRNLQEEIDRDIKLIKELRLSKIKSN